VHPFATVDLLVSLLILLGFTASERRSSSFRALLLTGIAAAGYLALLRYVFGFPSPPAGLAMGAEEPFWPLTLAMYMSMLLGMAAQVLHDHVDSKPDSKDFSARTLIKPLLVSPLVFMPLAASLQNSNANLPAFDRASLMLLLVAFENGFLWRGYYTRKMSTAKKK
jgi:hypothetical protein